MNEFSAVDRRRSRSGGLFDGGDGLDGFSTSAPDPPRAHRLSEHEDDDTADAAITQGSRVVTFDERDPYGFGQRSNRAGKGDLFVDHSDSFLSCREESSDHAMSDDDRSSNASFHTALHSEAAASQEDASSDFNVEDFMTCQDRNDLSYQQDLSSMHSDDDTSFHSCRRFNEQGLRSVLAVPTYKSADPDARFNIPLHVVAKGIKDFSSSSSSKQQNRRKEEHRRRRIWLPLVIALVVLLICATVAGVLLALSRKKGHDEDNKTAQTFPAEGDTEVQILVTKAPAGGGIRGVSPSAAPSESPSLQNLVFETGNFTQVTEFPTAAPTANASEPRNNTYILPSATPAPKKKPKPLKLQQAGDVIESNLPVHGRTQQPSAALFGP